MTGRMGGALLMVLVAAMATLAESKFGGNFLGPQPVHAAVKPKESDLGGVVSLFAEEESEYHRYAAAVAATEPLRELRDARAKQALGNVKYGSLKMQKKNVCAADPQGKNEALQLACSTHVVTVSKIIRSLGLTVSEFNNLSRLVSADPVLRDRVMKQAYLFRISADVGDDSWMPEILPRSAERAPAPVPVPVPAPVVGSPSKDTAKAKPMVTEMDAPAPAPAPIVGMEYEPTPAQAKRPKRAAMPVTLGTFTVASDKVEKLRMEQRIALQNELDTTELPPNLCSPTMQPVLTTRVKSLCESFPKEAEKVVEDLGMSIQQFNDMLERSRRDPIMRIRMRLAWNAHKKTQAAQL